MAKEPEKKEGGRPEPRSKTKNWYGSGEQAPGKNEADAGATVSTPEDVPSRHKREREEAWSRHDSEFSDMRKRHSKELAELLDRHASEQGGADDGEDDDEGDA